MSNLKYSQEELAILEEALSNAIDDLESLWQIGALEEISVRVVLPGFSKCNEDYTNHNWSLQMNNKGIYLIQGDEYSNRSYWFGKRRKSGQLEKFLTVNEQDIIFLNHFYTIREDVAKVVEEAVAKKKVNLDKAKLITQRYNQEATIEIDLPSTNNQQTIEVVEENGKKVGTLTFGNIALKIITSANIEFKNKNEPEAKTKRK